MATLARVPSLSAIFPVISIRKNIKLGGTRELYIQNLDVRLWLGENYVIILLIIQEYNLSRTSFHRSITVKKYAICCLV